MAVTLAQLRTFLAVMRTGSVTRAADELVVTQPSVSAAMTALSRELGVPLTEPAGRTIRPSAAGRAFEPYAADVIGLLDRGRRAAREAVDAASRELRIAAVTTAAEHIVPPLMQGLAARRPDLSLTLEVGNRAQVFERLLDRRADVAVGGRPPEEHRVIFQAFLDNEAVLIAAPDDPLAQAESVEPAEVATRPWLLREEGSGTRVMCERVLAENHLDPRRLTLGSNGAIKQAARAGLGIALQSRVAVEHEISCGLLAAIPARLHIAARQWYVVRAAAGPVSEAVDYFIGYVTSPAGHAELASALEAGGPPPPSVGADASDAARVAEAVRA